MAIAVCKKAWARDALTAHTRTMPRPYNVEEEHFDGDDDDVSESADDGDDAFAEGVHLDVEEEELAAAAQGGPKKGRRFTFTMCASGLSISAR